MNFSYITAIILLLFPFMWVRQINHQTVRLAFMLESTQFSQFSWINNRGA